MCTLHWWEANFKQLYHWCIQLRIEYQFVYIIFTNSLIFTKSLLTLVDGFILCISKLLSKCNPIKLFRLFHHSINNDNPMRASAPIHSKSGWQTATVSRQEKIHTCPGRIPITPSKTTLLLYLLLQKKLRSFFLNRPHIIHDKLVELSIKVLADLLYCPMLIFNSSLYSEVVNVKGLPILLDFFKSTMWNGNALSSTSL